MVSQKDMLRLQAEAHPLVPTEEFATLEEYCLYLIHLKPYEEAATLAHQKIVLDLGCNNGYGTNLIGRDCKKIVGVDVSTHAIEVARQKTNLENVEFQLIDGQVLPFPDQSFDLVVSFQVIEHIADCAPFLLEIKRVLAPGGLTIFTTPNARIRLDPGMKPWNEFHAREFCAKELGELLSPWFSNVELRGLFAQPGLYDVEFGRVQRALRKKRGDPQELRSPWMTQIISWIKSWIKRILPGAAIRQIRSLIPSRKRPDFKYTTRDLFYRSDGLDESLDLMAVCSN